jgi:hypothetical protein
MRSSVLLILLAGVMLAGCGKPVKPPKVLVEINDYKVTLEEFESGFAASPYASRSDRAKARKEYLDNLVNQKVILLDAQKKNIDKQKDFLVSIERFWEQSLLTAAVGSKTREIMGAARVSEEDIQKLYDQMVKDKVTEKPYQDMYPQIKWQAERQLEAQMLADWVDGLRRSARISIDEKLFSDKQ